MLRMEVKFSGFLSKKYSGVSPGRNSSQCSRTLLQHRIGGACSGASSSGMKPICHSLKICPPDTPDSLSTHQLSESEKSVPWWIVVLHLNMDWIRPACDVCFDSSYSYILLIHRLQIWLHNIPRGWEPEESLPERCELLSPHVEDDHGLAADVVAALRLLLRQHMAGI